MTLHELLQRLESATGSSPSKSGDGYSCRCPAHEDKNPSLSITEGKDGRLLMKCHAGCSFESILSALGLSASDFAPNAKPRREAGRPAKQRLIDTYSYRDVDGTLLFEVCRFEPKGFRQRRPDAGGGFVWNLKDVKLVPFRLPELIAAVREGRKVFIVEGEKDVLALVEHGLVATCNSGGAGKWRDDFGPYLDGAKEVVVIADKDAPGRAHAVDVANKLRSRVQSLKVLELPDIGSKAVKDASDHFIAGGTMEDLERLAAGTPEHVVAERLSPSQWFKRRYPGLAEKYGEPVHESDSKDRPKVMDLGEDFMAATLGGEGTPEAPTVFLPCEGRFYIYDPELGFFQRRQEEDIAAQLSRCCLDCVRGCDDSVDKTRLEFRLRDTAAMAGIVKRARGLLRVPDDYFATSQLDFVPVANGVLRLADRTLLPFSPSYRFRHRLAVKFDPDAYCPLFMEKLLKPALGASDVHLFQLWSGLALLGVNRSHKILLITGTAGGGKSTLVSVINGIIGESNIGTLRTDSLGDRFEIGRLFNKTLLYGADVSEDFLTKRNASALKTLTGGDLMTVEFKNSNESPQLKCEFNIVVTSNSRLTVHLEGDTEAWRRRLLILSFNKPKPPVPIHDLAGRILKEEGPGVLNFMLDGLKMLSAANWEFRLTEEQLVRVDDLLLESESHRVFIQQCLIKDSEAHGMTKADVYAAYLEFCEERSWSPLPRNRFGQEGAEAITKTFGLPVRGDIQGADGKMKDGWKFLRLKKPQDFDP